MSYRPALADLPDHRLWRFDPAAGYGPLNTAARGKIDVARLSPFVTRHLNVLGHYSFRLPGLGGGQRPLRDPDAEDDEE